MKRIAVPLVGLAVLAIAACSEEQSSRPTTMSSASPPTASSTTVTPETPGPSSASNTNTSNNQITWDSQRSPASRQSRVSTVQSDLAALGYNPGPIDGKIGPKTRAAVRKYQQDHKMTVNGRISARLAQSLAQQRQTAGR